MFYERVNSYKKNRVIISRGKILLKLYDTECNKNTRNGRVRKIYKFYFRWNFWISKKYCRVANLSSCVDF